MDTSFEFKFPSEKLNVKSLSIGAVNSDQSLSWITLCAVSHLSYLYYLPEPALSPENYWRGGAGLGCVFLFFIFSTLFAFDSRCE